MNELERFFLEPQKGLHSRYEALRALCVEKLPADQVAKRFGYTVDTVNAMMREFEKVIESGGKPNFFLKPTLGAKPETTQTDVKPVVIAVRKK
jgi:hypothetical protein